MGAAQGGEEGREETDQSLARGYSPFKTVKELEAEKAREEELRL